MIWIALALYGLGMPASLSAAVTVRPALDRTDRFIIAVLWPALSGAFVIVRIAEMLGAEWASRFLR